MTMTELKEFIMENVVETKQDNIVVPEVEEIDVKFMSRKEMKVIFFIINGLKLTKNLKTNYC